MFSTAEKYTENISEQEDIVQSALERLLKIASDTSRPKCYFSASYVVFTVRSVSIDFQRKRDRDSAFLAGQKGVLSIEAVRADGSIDDLLSAMEHSERLMTLWPQIPDEDRILLEGKYIFDLTDKELAGILGSKPDGIRMRLVRARRRAAKFLSERNG